MTVPHTAGQHTWSGTSNGMTIHASISPETPHAGSPVTFTVHVSGPASDCCAVYIVFGDGGVTDGIGCPLPTTGGSATATFTHTYNKPGPHSMLIQAISHKCQDNGELYGTISNDAQNDFHMLFGREFLRAYQAHVTKVPARAESGARK